MSAGKQDQLRLGFLTAIELPDKGYVGGLLVTTHHGRPLEFQCTLPVKANSTQEILYGPTLPDFLLGELIAGALVDKAGVKPHVVLTDRESILELRNHVDSPVALVSTESTDQPHLKLGRQVLRFHAAHAEDRQALEAGAKKLPEDADLCEPFQRVREALQETVKLGALK